MSDPCAHMPLDTEEAYATTGRTAYKPAQGGKVPGTSDRMDTPPPYIKDDPVVKPPD